MFAKHSIVEIIGLIASVGDIALPHRALIVIAVSLIAATGSAVGSGAVVYFSVVQRIQTNASHIQFNAYKIDRNDTQTQQQINEIKRRMRRIYQDYYGPTRPPGPP